MAFISRKKQKISFIVKCIFSLFVLSLSPFALAEYYVVYSTVEYATPAPIVYYQTSSSCHVKHVIKHKRHSCYHVMKHKKSSAVVTVYSVVNNCGQCFGSCNGCSQVLMPTCQGCGYRVFYGEPVWHSDYYYMQGFNEDDPDIDGNTYDNDIY
ncbi:MAG: hypothetical protein JO131_09450 [Gammaproteobacteria bacterium]|nr:hypothetical protein [Gammaproteobacteria bacterium]